MEPAGDEVDVLVDRGGGFDDLVNSRMRAADDDDHALGCINRERELLEFQRGGLVGDQRDQMNAGRDFGGLVD